MPPIDYKACCVFASGLTLRTDTWLTDRPSAHPVHKLYPDLPCPCCVHYSLCVANAQHETHFILQGDELGYSVSVLFSLHVPALDLQGICRPSWDWSWACTFVLEWAAQQSECKALLGLDARAEAKDGAALEAVLSCIATCVVDGSNFGTALKCKVK